MAVETGEGQLVENFYSFTCPSVEAVVQQVVTNKISQTFITIPATLRLFFHDCFVEVVDMPCSSFYSCDSAHCCKLCHKTSENALFLFFFLQSKDKSFFWFCCSSFNQNNRISKFPSCLIFLSTNRT